ncbi:MULTISPECIES: MarR family transcriptional regulator [Thermocrispum]|uniref:MarR family transcriptional regulator n=1 Tax=Thermocrispum agreste TaxID=37925 RepID=A0A2W4JLX2_9PSEU|nr:MULTISPECIES: MarR family transcriptional regulator [Thermocrispum]PZN00125.1 MAG: MarR family transcriptional regulator [Thermocrispum agreste]
MTGSGERERLVTSLACLQRDLARALIPDHQPPFVTSSLTMQQLRLVVHLALDGPASSHELAAKLRVAMGTLTGIVDRLVAQGLVARRVDPDDRRIRRVELTDEGQAMADRMLDAGAAQFRRVLERLDTETLRQFEQVMHSLIAAARQLRDERSGDRAGPVREGRR